MKILSLFICLLSAFGCVDYYVPKFSPSIGLVRLSDKGTSNFSVLPSANGVSVEDYKGEFKDLRIMLSFDNGKKSNIIVKLQNFTLTDEKGNTRDLLDNIKTYSPDKEFNDFGEPKGYESFSSSPLPDLKEGRYTIHFSGNICEAENCYDFDQEIQVKLIFSGQQYWVT